MLDTSKIYTSKNYGDFKIINYTHSRKVDIEFISTGYRKTVRAGCIVRGEVKDLLHPNLFGIGFIGTGNHKAQLNGETLTSYNTWSNMLRRCYCPKALRIRPTYKDCTVCVEWHNFQNFAEWYEINHMNGMAIDKDIKIDGNRVYSPDTCIFVSASDNSVKANAKNYIFISPLGVKTKIYNIAEFCRKNNISHQSMRSVHSGKQGNHKGWTKHQKPDI